VLSILQSYELPCALQRQETRVQIKITLHMAPSFVLIQPQRNAILLRPATSWCHELNAVNQLKII